MLEKINKHSLASFRQFLAMRGASARSIKRKESSLKKFFSWAVEKGYLDARSIQDRRFIPILDRKISLQAFRALPFLTYFNLIILLVFGAALGFGIYQQFILKAPEKLAYPAAPVPPNRYLSFQGRLTDSANTPITTATNMRFRLYDASSGGNTLWDSWDSGTCSIDPDEDGIFNTILGSDCGGAIASSVFSENVNVWLGITVGSDPEATPRIQIATVAYALNAETLQGFPLASATNAEPTATMGATVRTVPAVNPAGNLVIASASPKIWSTSGTFQIRGQALSIVTDTGTGGNITIAPDTSGVLNLTLSAGTGNVINSTDANLGSSGGKEANTLLYGSVANNNTNVNLLKLESGSTPTPKFTVDYAGNASMAGTLKVLSTAAGALDVAGGIYVGTSDAFIVGTTGIITAGTWNATAIATGYGGTGQDWSGVAQGSLPYFSGTGTMTTLAPGISGYVLSTQGAGANPVWVAQSGGTNYWALANGTLYPVNSTLDLLIGGTATSSAKFAFINVLTGTPTASFSGNLVLAGGQRTITATDMNPLTIGNASTGNIQLAAGSATPAFVLTTAGNVGIGTTGPTNKLEVQGGNIGLIYGNSLKWRISDGVTWYNVLGMDSSNDVFLSSPNYQSKLYLKVNPGTLSNAMVFNYDGNAAIGYDTPGTAKLAISGNVGIGTTNPSSFKLEVAGNIGPEATGTRDLGSTARVWNNVYANNYYQGSTALGLWLDSGTYIYPANVGTGFQIADTSGNLSTAGTASFNSGGVTIDSSNFVNAARFVDTAGSGAYFLDPAAAASLNIAGYATTAASLAVGYSSLPSGPGNAVFSGNVGIGTTGPLTKLHISDSALANIRLQDTETNGAAWDIASDVIGTTPVINFAQSGVADGQLMLSGGANARLGIDVGANVPANTLSVNGNAAIGATYYGTAAPSNGMIIEGNVGIGTTGPSSKLTVLDSLASGVRGIQLKVTGDHASAGEIGFIKERTTGQTALDNDYIGGLVYRFYNDAVTPELIAGASILGQVIDASDGTEDADLIFNQVKGGLSTEVMRFKDGSVGIGTTDPGSYKLYVAGNQYNSGGLTLAGDLRLNNNQILNSAGTATIIFSSTPSTSYNTLDAGNWLVSNTANLGQAALMINQTMGGDIFTASVSGTPKFVISNAGNVGIGTTNLQANLHVLSTATTGTAARIEPYALTTGTGLLLTVNSNALTTGRSMTIQYTGTHTATLTNSGEVVYINRTPDISIAGQTLTISGAALKVDDNCTVNAGTCTHSGNTVDIVQNYTSASGTTLYVKNYGGASSTSFRVDDASGDTSPFIIDSSGNVGIGTTGPSATLDVSGYVYINSTSESRLAYTGDTYMYTAPVADSYVKLGVWDTSAGALPLALQPVGGNVGIGTTSPTTDKLEVVGTAGAGGNGLLLSGNDVALWGKTTGAVRTRLIFLGSTDNTYINAPSTKGVIFRTAESNTAWISSAGALTTVDRIAPANLSNWYIHVTGSNPLINYDANDYFTYDRTNNYAQWVLVGSKEMEMRPTGVYADDSFNNNAWDYAENFISLDQKEPGSVMCFSSTQRIVVTECRAQDQNLAGVISTKPGFLTGESINEEENDPNRVPITLAGRVPTKVSTLNGPIAIGDLITSSEIPGVGMRATQAGFTVGRALEPYDNPDPSAVGKIMVFVNLSWYDPDVYLTSAGELNIRMTPNEVNPNESEYSLVDAAGEVIERVGAFAEIAVAQLKAGLIQTQELLVNHANVNELKANVSELANVKTGIISPLPDSSDVTIRLGRDVKDTPLRGGFGKLLVQNQEDETVASIDSSGSAYFAGQISADSMQISTDATVAGTLYADEIITKHGKFGDLLAGRITTTTVSAPSPTPTPELTGTDPVTPEASESALLAEVQSWQISDPSQDLKITSNLKVLGRTSLASTTVAGPLSQDGSLILDQGNSINVITGTLYLQNFGFGGVDILAGKVVIDIDGNVQVAGNLAVGGEISASSLVLERSNLSGGSTSEEESGFGKLLTILNKEGQEVASIDASGKISADSLLISADYSATQSATLAEIRTNATSGLGVLPAGQTEFTIFNPKVGNDTLVYITPVTNTQNKVLYVLAKKTGEFFKVAVDTPVEQDIVFNWWIIN